MLARAFAQMPHPRLLGALVFLTVIALFSPATGYDFVGLDDEPYVSDNPMTRGGLSANSLKWAMTARVVGHWAPLLWMSYMLDGTLFGPSPWGFHFTNVFLHAINAALVFLLLRGWTGRTWAACWGALFWALHPLRVESVAWITERKDVLCGLFFLLCILSYTRGYRPDSGRWRRLGIPTLFLCAGLMVKPALVTVPFVLLLLDVWPLRRANPAEPRALLPLIVEKWPLWLASLGLGAASWMSNVASGIPHAQMPPLAHRLLLIPGNYFTYLRQLVWPVSLSALYPRPVFSGWTFLAALALLAGITAAGWFARARRGPTLVGWFWFLGMLVPSIGLVWMGTTEGAGDRFTYLPTIGLSLLLVCRADPRTMLGRVCSAIAGVFAIAAAIWFTAHQLPVWTNSGTLFRHVLALHPDNLQANLNYGIWLRDQGNPAAAKEHYLRALSASPVGPKTIGEAGYAWVLQGRADAAIALLEPALYNVRATPLIHGAYGMARLHQGDAAAAVRHLAEAVSMDPQDQELRVELIRACFEAGDVEGALRNVEQLAKWPGEPVRNLGDLFGFYIHRWRSGEKPYAWSYFERLVKTTPDAVPLLNNLAWLAATDENAPRNSVAKAVEYAARAARLTGNGQASVLDSFAAALASAGDFAAAASVAEDARRLAEENGNTELAANIAQRLERYRRGQPWRE